MILVGLVVLAVVAQAVITKTWLEDDTVNLLEAWIWYAISLLNATIVGRRTYKIWAWLYMTKLRPRIYCGYQRWSMEQEVENLTQARLHIPMLVLLALWSLWTIPTVVSAIAPVIAEATDFLDEPWHLVLFLPLVFLASILWIAQEYDALDRKWRELEGLRPVYKRCFPVSELLSMYECLRVAPRIFWEEYKDLPDMYVNEVNNRKFRERAASYSGRASHALQRRALIVAVLAVVAAVLTLIEASTGGELVGWFVEGLSK